MKKHIGRDVRYVAVEDGPPVRAFDLPDGLRAFQYYLGGGAAYVPRTTTTSGQVQLIGDGAYYREGRIESGGFVIESEGCLVTYIAEWNQARAGWIVRDISYPKRLAC